MWNFDDKNEFELICSPITIPATYTYGGKDRENREIIRKYAVENLSGKNPRSFKWYGFRILVYHTELRGKEKFDVGNVHTLILDAFSGWQIERDNSMYSEAILYPDDTIRFVRAIQLEAEFENANKTEICIFGKK